MANNIFDIGNWAPNTFYSKDSPVKNGNYYYYALVDHTSNGGNFDTDGTKWGGISTDSNGEIKPTFLWIPSYQSTTNNNPRIKEIKYGDGYTQTSKDGINNLLLDLDLSFDNRKLNEISAILHFFNIRQGTESFLFTPPPPYAKRKRFICKTWNHVPVFYDNHSVKAKFEEKVI